MYINVYTKTNHIHVWTACADDDEDKFHRLYKLRCPFSSCAFFLTCCCCETFYAVADVEKLHISHESGKVSAPTKREVRS